MPFIPALNTIKLNILATIDGQRVENVLYFTKATAITPTNITDLHTGFNSFYTTFVGAHMAIGYIYTGGTVQDISSSSNPITNFAPGSPVSGSVSGITLPGNCAICCTKRTAFSGRNNRGRLYLGGQSAGVLATPSTISGAKVTALLSSLAPLLIDTLVTSLFHSVVSFFSGVDVNHKPIPRGSGVSHPVTAWTVDTSVDSQRRRLVGRGF